jgi:chaperone LolA
MARLRRLVLLLALVATAAAADAVADAQAARRVESVLGGLTTLRADFRQTVTDQDGGIVEQAEGTLALARPGRFRWDYRVPEQLIVSDGRSVWFYDVELEQVTIRGAAETLQGTPAMLLAGQGELTAEYSISDAPEQEGLAWSVLTPRRSDGDFRELRLGFAGGDLRRMLLFDRLGQVTRLDFDRIERNPRLESSLFRLVPPEGVDVVGRVPPG